MPKYNFPSTRNDIDLTGLSFEHYPPKKEKSAWSVVGDVALMLLVMAMFITLAVAHGI